MRSSLATGKAARPRAARVLATAQPGETPTCLVMPMGGARHGSDARPAFLTGGKVEKWLQTPYDIAAFGPRVALGALVSLPERLQML